MFSSEDRLDRKIEVLKNGDWIDVSPKDLEEGQVIRMWGLFIDANGNSAFEITSSVYNMDGHKNVDVKPIDLTKEKENG
jgi:hypothetical protein